MMKRWRIIAAAGLALVVIGGAGYWGVRSSQAKNPTPAAAPDTVAVERGDVAYTVTGPGVSVDNGETILESRVAGRVESLLVRPGDRITAGQILAALGDRTKFEDAVKEKQVQVLNAQQALEDLIAKAPKESADALLALLDAQGKATKAQATVDAMKYPRANQQRIDAANNDYQQALQNVALAQKAYDEVTNLPEYDSRRIDALNVLTEAQMQRDHFLGLYNWLTGKPTDADVAQAQAALKQAQADVAVAQHTYGRIKDGPDPTKLDLAKATLEDAKAQFREAQADVKNLEIRAPFDGSVLDVAGRVGQSVADGAPLMTVSNSASLEAQVTVVEEDLRLIHVGQPCTLFFDAYADQDLTGKIARILTKRAEEDKPVYSVFIQINKTPKDMVAGMTVDATIIIDEKKDVLRLPRTVIRSLGNDQAEVSVWNGVSEEKRTIQVGLRGDSYVEVLSGIKEGTLVVSR